MKGVILAGGTGSRLQPNTKVVNKHLLPVARKPMIFYPIETLKNSGVREILIISDTKNIGDFMRLLGSGKNFGVNFTFKIQDGAGGVAAALSLAENFAAGSSIAVILGDNIFEENFTENLLRFKFGAEIFLKKVRDPERFGIVEISENGQIKSIEEKPAIPKSNLAQTGFYIFDKNIFSVIREIIPSNRGELEITDVVKKYVEKKNCRATEIFGAWADAGTHEGLLEASILAFEIFDSIKIRRHKKISEKKISPKITIGILTHNSEKYVETCVQSILQQNYENFEIIILDNFSTDKTREILREKFPEIKLIESEKNLGFSRGHNEILRKSQSDFYLTANIDMIFEPNFLSEIIDEIDKKPIFGSASGKIKKWDFQNFLEKNNENGKTNFIDSAGIRILKSHRFENIGENEIDCGQFDEKKEIFGASGVAAIFRRKALEDVAFLNKNGEKEFFDESMFMYKEDVDLAYRLQWAGWKSIFAPAAIAYHDRTAKFLGRRTVDLLRGRAKKSKFVNQISYLNHHLLLKKNFSEKFSPEIRRATFFYNCKIFFYLLFFETKNLLAWWKIFRLRDENLEKRKSIPRRISGAEIEKLMES